MAVRTRPCPPATFRRLVRPLIGLPVSRVWQSFAWTLFLELGRLRRDGSRRLCGECEVMLDYGWRVEGPDGILADSRAGASKIRRTLRGLRGRTVRSVGVEGRLPELSLRLSGGVWVRSLTVVAEGAEWALFLSRRPETSDWIAPKGRRLVHETGFQVAAGRSRRR